MWDLYVRLCRPARTFVLQHVPEEAAEDIVQQAFLEVVEATFRDDAAPPQPADALFFRILRLRCVDYIRLEARETPVPAQDISGEVLPLAWRDNRDNPALVADGSMLAARVDYVIETMPPEMRRVMRAGREHDWEARAIAEATGINHGLVKWHLKEGRERLRRQLEKDGYAVPAHLKIGRPAGRAS